MKIFKNKKVKVLFIVGLVLACIVGGLFFARNSIQKNKVIGVDPVEYWANTWSVDESSGYGVITEGGSQSIFLQPSLLLEKVYVSLGDQVKKGDPILKYDNTQNKLQIDSYRIAYEMSKNNLKKAQKQLEYYKTFVPYEDRYVDIRQTEDVVDATTAPTSKNENTYTFDVNMDSEIKKDFFDSIITNYTIDSQIIFDIYYVSTDMDSVLVAKLSIDNTQLNASEDVKINEFLELQYDGRVIPTNKAIIFGSFNIVNPQIKFEEIPYEESLSEKEINQLIKSQEDEIARLEIATAQADLDYRKAKASSEDGIVKAETDGIVSFISDSKIASDSEPYITIKSALGYEITTTIDEYQLNKFKVGDSFTIRMWSNGMEYNAIIKSISTYPSTYNYSYNYGSNASNYEVIADLECEDELESWDSGEITFEKKETSALFSIESCFVREENGQYYVLVANENDRIEKRYIEVGNYISGGYYIEIISGLDLQDQIAFPYGKNAVEGAKVDYDMEVYSW